ncbi:tail fiber domain-containing protein [Bdellovibrio bacteriovorus]|uniref:tail fiber domain-containing protein n=1 Tax=Bdellovibrio bacteriovorus TaxID=959 RepID=UPI0009BE327A|nr:tail fiber domain-containing protein [Bdellovibrio bacteriovorus]
MRFLFPLNVLIWALIPALLWATPNSLNYQGRILKDDGTPLLYNNVSFSFEITNAAETCIMYREQVNGVNLSATKGVFDISIGSGTKIYPTTAFQLSEAFQSGVSINCDGTAPITPTAIETRKLRVQFFDGSTWKSITPALEIHSVPFAFSAAKLEGKSASDFVIKTGLPVCGAGTFLSWSGSALTCEGVTGSNGGTVTNVTSTNSYLSVTNGTSTPALTLNVGTTANTVAAGNDSRFTDSRNPTGTAGGDLGGTYPSPDVVKLRGVAVASTTPTATNNLLKFDGTGWAPGFVTISDVRSTAAGNTTFFPTTCTTAQTLNWESATDKYICADIAIPDSKITYASQTAKTFFAAPTAGGAPSFRAIASSDLPTTGADGVLINGGNTFSANSSIGLKDAFNLSLLTNNSPRLSILGSGQVGVQTSTPPAPFTVQNSLLATASSTAAALTPTQVLVNDAIDLPTGQQASLLVLSQPTQTANGTGQYNAAVFDINSNTGAFNLQGTRGLMVINTKNGSGTVSNQVGGIVGSLLKEGTATSQAGFQVTASASASTTLGNQYGTSSSVTNTSSGTVTVQTAYQGTAVNSSGSTVTNQHALFASSTNSGTAASQYGVLSKTTHDAGNTLPTQYGTYTVASNNGLGTITNAHGNFNQVFNAGAGTTTNAYGTFSQIWNDGTGTIDKAYGYYADVYNPNGGTVATGYGLYLGSVSATAKWSIWANDATAPSYFAGRIGIGTATPTHNLQVEGTAGLSTGTAWTNTSDIRLKDIQGDYEYGLNEILKLHTVRFTYKKDNPLKLSSKHKMTGFIAQEVQKVIPDAVKVRPDGYLELNVDPIHWATVNAVQELNGKCEMSQEQVSALKREVSSLKEENTLLKMRLEKQNQDLEMIKKKLGLAD